MEFGQKIVYQTDANGFYVCEAIADPDPLTQNQWLLPAGCVDEKPPLIIGMKVPRWIGYKWKMVDPE